jgi:hypothetical protein
MRSADPSMWSRPARRRCWKHRVAQAAGLYPVTTLRDLRDLALITTLTYSFARINAALKMKVEDLRPRGAGWTIRLHEKRGQQQCRATMRSPKHRRRRYRRGPQGLAVPHRARSQRHDVVRQSHEPARRLANDPPARRGGRHCGADWLLTFRATGITAYLANGGALEPAHTKP